MIEKTKTNIDHDGIYQAKLSFVDFKKREEYSTIITFKASSEKDAVDAAYRFAQDRIKVLPDIFPFLGCCKVWRYYIKEIDMRGSLLTCSGFDIHEWKYDWYPMGVK